MIGWIGLVLNEAGRSEMPRPKRNRSEITGLLNPARTARSWTGKPHGEIGFGIPNGKLDDSAIRPARYPCHAELQPAKNWKIPMPDELEVQQCVTCEKTLQVSYFWKQKSKKNGLQSECKYCMKLRTTQYHRDNRKTLRPRNNAVITKRRKNNPIKALLSGAKSRAKFAGIEFSITENDITLPDKCPILGIELKSGFGMGFGRLLHEKDSRFSIDRIDNQRGYTSDNVIIVSYRANRLKSDASLEEIKKIASFYEQLESKKIGKTGLSQLQPHTEKQNGKMLERFQASDGNDLLLPSLRIQGGQ